MDKLKISKGTIIRILILLLSLVNAVLNMAGLSPIDLTDADLSAFVEILYEAISYAILIVSAIWAAWKNNSVTQAALKADIYLDETRKLEAAQAME